MLLTYEKRNEGMFAEWKKPIHVPPHLHEAIEVVYVTDGTVDLGVSKYVISRLFAKTYHCNFNKYESQRTFNRVFKERYKMTPREYRNKLHDIE